MEVEDFSSKEEFYFWCWLKELEEAGVIKDIGFQYKFENLTEEMYAVHLVYLKTKVKSVPKKILSSAAYTADFYFTVKRTIPFILDLTNSVSSVDPSKFKGLFSIDNKCFVDTKGRFNDYNNERITKRSRMIVWTVYRQFVNIVRIPDFFHNTFMPHRYTLTDKTKKPRKIDKPYSMLSDFDW